MLLSDPPIVSLRLGLELGTDAIEEGKDVYFECKIKANPDIYKISWTHNVTFKLLMVQLKLVFCREIESKKEARQKSPA